jgi:aminoglycoside phosphotransferase family enzyme/predicted kinase
MDQTGSQDAVLRFLGDPATHGGRAVRRIDTHANVVFLVGDRALKVKRAVRFPFLDYSTLGKRKAACTAELEVNRNFAPELYRRVVPITRAASGKLAVDGEGEPIEWAVEMLRFDEDQTLDRIAETRGIGDDLAARLADMVLAMHRAAPIADAAAWIAALAEFLNQNVAAFREEPVLFDAERAASLASSARSELERWRGLLLARGERGLTRKGHGDLHLGNIALLDGQPVPFDAIEFDPNVASGDVLYDLAFLLMDLIDRGLGHAANIVLNGYFAPLRQSDDLDGLAALPLFLSVRAAIRAKVTAARRQFVEPADRTGLGEKAQGYFRLAADLIATPPPLLVAIGGLSGTGKSSLARELAAFVGPAPGALIIRSDVERKKLFGVAETHPLPPEAYRPEASARTYDVLADKAACVIAARHSAIVDAVFAKSEERRAIAAVGDWIGVSFRGLFLVADLGTRLARVGGRVLDASDADAEVARLQETFELGEIQWTEIDASGSLQETLALARSALSKA